MVKVIMILDGYKWIRAGEVVLVDPMHVEEFDLTIKEERCINYSSMVVAVA